MMCILKMSKFILPTLIGRGIKRWCCLTSVAYKVKGQGHQAALLNAALTRQAAAAVSVGMYWPWELTATLRSALQARSTRRREALRRPQREERGGGICGGRPPTAFSFIYPIIRPHRFVWNNRKKQQKKLRRVYTVFRKKNTHLILAHNIGKCWQIFKILSPSDSPVVL